MIVLDAAAAVHLLLGSPRYAAFLHTSLTDPHWVVPENFVLETASGLQSAWLGGDINEAELDAVLEVLAGLPLDIWPTRPLLPRIRQLAQTTSAYTAAYLALAEELGIPFLTTDSRLATVPGVRAHVLSPAENERLVTDSAEDSGKLLRLPSNGRGLREPRHPAPGTAQ
jgi:predicted nucleic acid-binding protein